MTGRERSTTWWFVLFAGCIVASRSAAAEDFKEGVSGELQTNVRVGDGAEGVNGFRWYESEMRMKVDLNPRWHFWGAGHVEQEEKAHVVSLEESYFALTDGNREYRFGRFRIPFGIFDRQEVEYSGLVDPALVKDETVRGFQLGRVDTGLMVMGGKPDLRYEAAVVNGTFPEESVDNNGTKDVCLRLQVYRKRLIAGANFYDGKVLDTTAAVPMNRAVRYYGLDWRYTLPNLIARGEWAVGAVDGQHTQGWHLDLLYHTPSVEDLTLLARYEQFDPNTGVSGDTETRWAMGAKYFIRPDINLALNYNRESNVAGTDRRRTELQVSKTIFF